MIGNKILLARENTVFEETTAAGDGNNSHGGETPAAGEGYNSHGGETTAAGEGDNSHGGETTAAETGGSSGGAPAAKETTRAHEETTADTKGDGSEETTGTDANLSGTGGQSDHEGETSSEGESGDSSESIDVDSFFEEGETSEGDESLSAESGAEEASTESYIIDENGETQVIFDAEPETEYMVSTPADASSGAGSGSGNTSAFSQAYHSAAGAVAKTAQSAVKSAAPTLKNIGFNFLSAILIVIVGVYLSKLLKKLLDRAFEKIHMDASLRSFISSAAYVLGCGMAGFMALERIGVSTASIITVLGSAGLAVSLSLRDFLTNFAGGMIILVLKPFRTGDYIICGTAEGTVVSTSLFYTTLDTVDNRQMVLPNGALSNANIINVTAEPRRRLEIRVDISYESDIRQAKAILSRLFDMHPDIMHDEEVVVFVDNLGESGITLVARGWVVKEKYWTTKWQMTEDLKYAFDEAGVVIPYRQVVVHTPEEDGIGEEDTKRR